MKLARDLTPRDHVWREGGWVKIRSVMKMPPLPELGDLPALDGIVVIELHPGGKGVYGWHEQVRVSLVPA